MDHHLLLIGNEICSIRHLAEELRKRGCTVATASKFDLATDPGFGDNFDVIVIDHCERRINASDICVELRRRSFEVLIVVLAEPGPIHHRVDIFKAGADDYLVKPVDIDELQVRIESLLIRSIRSKKQESSSYEFGGRRVDFIKSTLVHNGSKIELSEREASLLRYFVQNRGKTISRGSLLQHVWGYRRAPFTRTVDVHILRLRHKVEDNPKDPQFIVTVPGFGYRFDG